ncbi:uncharacterized protein LOC123270575 [Cotesia glomerata]|nr:uncharacterized protein LOC123270575 [Cotesia glomerata]
MSLFFHYHCSQSLTIKKSALITVENVFDLWSEAGIPTCAKNSAVRKLIRHHTVWKNLLKNKNQKLSSTQKKKVSIFCADIEKLFDIAHHKVMKLINESQKLFLQGQRQSNRRGFLHINPPVKTVANNIDEDRIDEIQSDENNTGLLLSQKTDSSLS